MILAFFRRRRQARAERAERARLSADQFIAAANGDLHAAFWRAHDRALDAATPKGDRLIWQDLVDEIDRRRPSTPPRPDTATRMLFGDRRP